MAEVLLSREFAEAWLAKLRAAWLEANLAAVRSLFAKTAAYYETPFHEPATK